MSLMAFACRLGELGIHRSRRAAGVDHHLALLQSAAVKVPLSNAERQARYRAVGFGLVAGAVGEAQPASLLRSIGTTLAASDGDAPVRPRTRLAGFLRCAHGRRQMMVVEVEPVEEVREYPPTVAQHDMR